MSHLVVCVLHYAFGKYGFSAKQRDSDARSETSIGDVVDPVLWLDEQVFQLVLCNVGFGRWVKASEDGGGNCIAGFNPGEEVCRGFAEVSANFQQGAERAENFGVGFNLG